MKDDVFKAQIHFSPWQYALLLAGPFFPPKVENLSVVPNPSGIGEILARACICLLHAVLY